MINIAVSQIKNSIDIEENFKSIEHCLSLIKDTDTDLILFPECTLSGFSSRIKDCTPDKIKPYLDKVARWSLTTGITVILPTALFDSKIYNTGYIFSSNKKEQFFKFGLTDSEEKFFSKPDIPVKKIFEIKGYKIALLICFEAQMNAHTFLKPGEADIILWPGYWGWDKGALWTATNEEGEPNLIHQNMESWKVPLIQSTFAFNDLDDDRSTGPHGLSMFINKDNKMFGQGNYHQEGCYKISINDGQIQKIEQI